MRLKPPSLGTALGLLALIVALAGTADAGPKHVLVKKGDLAKGAVTAKAIAAGAIKSKALAKGSIGAKALKVGAVSSSALASNAVTAAALAPGSVYGGAFGPVAVRTAPLVDLDQVEENGTWTASEIAAVVCAPGERVLSGGVVFTNPGNREVGVIQSSVFTNGGSNGWVGQITSNSGGTATAEVQAVCLK